MIRLFFENNSDKRVVEALRRKSNPLKQALVAKLTLLGYRLVAKIKNEKLQGQVLAQRTGKLAASVRFAGVEDNGRELRAVVEAAGGPAWYGIVQEFGGTRAYVIKPVNKKALAFFPTGSAGTTMGKSDLRAMYSGPMSKRSLRPGAYGNFASQGGVVVKSVVHPPLKERSFMRSALAEMSQTILEELQKTVDEVMNG